MLFTQLTKLYVIISMVTRAFRVREEQRFSVIEGLHMDASKKKIEHNCDASNGRQEGENTQKRSSEVFIE